MCFALIFRADIVPVFNPGHRLAAGKVLHLGSATRLRRRQPDIPSAPTAGRCIVLRSTVADKPPPPPPPPVSGAVAGPLPSQGKSSRGCAWARSWQAGAKHCSASKAASTPLRSMRRAASGDYFFDLGGSNCPEHFALPTTRPLLFLFAIRRYCRSREISRGVLNRMQ